jgi:hypothetical protein
MDSFFSKKQIALPQNNQRKTKRNNPKKTKGNISQPSSYNTY